MLLPNKVIRYEESVISKFPVVLQELKAKTTVKPKDLYTCCKPYFADIHIFLQTLDCLFALNKIELNTGTGEISLC